MMRTLMHSLIRLGGAALLLCGGPLVAQTTAERTESAEPAEPAKSGVGRLAWLAGCWASETTEAGSAEYWTAPAGRTMLGMGRTVKAGRTIEFEFMRIHEAAEGTLLFTALPSGQKETTFRQLRIGETEITFENPEHDFPQRVSYRLQGPSRLLASIEGQRQGTLRRIEFPMARVRCPAP